MYVFMYFYDVSRGSIFTQFIHKFLLVFFSIFFFFWCLPRISRTVCFRWGARNKGKVRHSQQQFIIVLMYTLELMIKNFQQCHFKRFSLFIQHLHIWRAGILLYGSKHLKRWWKIDFHINHDKKIEKYFAFCTSWFILLWDNICSPCFYNACPRA